MRAQGVCKVAPKAMGTDGRSLNLLLPTLKSAGGMVFLCMIEKWS